MGSIIDEIIDSLKRGQGKRMTTLVKMALEEGYSRDRILDEGLLSGMGQIAERFRSEEVGTPEILSITRALDKGIEALDRYADHGETKQVGTVVLGTVQGDMHDIGKNLVKVMMLSKNIRVIDLGVDVTPHRFVEETVASKAPILCISGILTRYEEYMKSVIEGFEERGIRNNVFIMVGGYFMDEEKAKQIGADCYTEDAESCAEQAYRYLTTRNKKRNQ